MATRYEHAGAAVPTTLAADYDPADPTLGIVSATGWPTGGVGPFVITIAAGTANEHKLLIESRSGTTLTVSDSSFDDTADVAHLAGVAVVHSFSAKEADEANDLAADITTLGGTVVTTSATQTLTGKSVDLTDNTLVGSKAEFNAAMTDGDFATLDGVETLANKTLTSPAMTDPDASGDLSGFGGAWTAHSPDINQGAAVTGTAVSNYERVGKRVTGECVVSITGGGTAGNNITSTLPVAPYLASPPRAVGSFYYTDSSTGIGYSGTVVYSAGSLVFIVSGNASPLGTNPSLQVGNGDTLSYTYTYETA